MNPKEEKNINQIQYIVGVIFLLLALGFIFDIWGSEKEIIEHPLIDPNEITTSTVRNPLTGPIIRHAGFKYNCNECHQNFKIQTERVGALTQHKNIIMEHGINNTCLNCHHPEKPEYLSDINEQPIPIVKSELLCQKCHGARYKDWLIGVHGKQTGYWDENRGVAKKETCVACHNPHSPNFKPMKPSKGPSRYNFSTDTKEPVHDGTDHAGQ